MATKIMVVRKMVIKIIVIININLVIIEAIIDYYCYYFN